MGGYSCQRRTMYGTYREVQGVGYIPTAYAATAVNQTYPEMFVGLYNQACSIGFDAGICNRTGSQWEIFMNGIGSTVPWSAYPVKATFSPGAKFYIRSWVSRELVSGSYRYYANLNVSKTSVYGTDLMAAPLKVQMGSAGGQTLYAGSYINREITIASNVSASIYETCGAYLYNGKFTAMSVINTSGTAVPWQESNTIRFTQSAAELYVTATDRQLRLRKDNATVNGNRIQASKAVDGSSNVTETASISFKATTPYF